MKNKVDTEKEREALMKISLQVWKEADNSKLAKEAISIAQKVHFKSRMPERTYQKAGGKTRSREMQELRLVDKAGSIAPGALREI